MKCKQTQEINSLIVQLRFSGRFSTNKDVSVVSLTSAMLD